MVVGWTLSLILAREFLGVIPILEPLHHEVELTDGEQEKPVIVENRHSQFCPAREVADGIFHLAVGRGALRKRGLLGRAS